MELNGIIRVRGDSKMRIAITDNGRNNVDQFGKTVRFIVYEVEQGQMKGRIVVHVSARGGTDGLFFILKNERVDVVLCGKIDLQMKERLGEYGIKVVDGLEGRGTTILKAYLKGKI